jgi:hypothetical protein
MNARRSFAPTPDDPPPDHDDGCAWCADVKAARAERRQGRLEELAELGMDLARAMPRQVADAAAPPADVAVVALAFTRVARAVRLTEALGDRLDNPPPAAAGRKAQADGAISLDAQEMEGAAMRVRGKLAKLVVRAQVKAEIEAEARERGDGFDTESLMIDLDERLGGTETIPEFAEASIPEMVARICRDLGLPFDEDLLDDEDDGPPPHGPAPPAPCSARPGECADPRASSP